MIRPLNDFVIVKIQQAPEKSKSGIFLVENSQEIPERGEVLSVGPKVIGIEAGDIVLFKKYAPSLISLEGESYLVVQQDEVIGIYVEA